MASERRALGKVLKDGRGPGRNIGYDLGLVALRVGGMTRTRTAAAMVIVYGLWDG